MVDAVVLRGVRPREERQEAVRPQPDLLDWLQSGRLTLLDEDRKAVDVESWWLIPADARERAQSDFQRLVRGNAKAAVLFLR
jgi:hypothetical protein